MEDRPVANRIQLRRDTAANWTSANPTLGSGEPGYETNTNKLKIGDGSTAWNSLAYHDVAATQEIWKGSATIDFGSTLSQEASVFVTGDEGNITTNSNVQVWIQDDSTVDNDSSEHLTLAYFSKCFAYGIVAGVGFYALVRLENGFSTGTYKIRYQYT